jgi:hypothetical protein
MRTAFALVVAAFLAASAAHAVTEYTPSETQQTGISMPKGTPWLLGSLSEKLQISHSVSFGYTSGGAFSGPSGQYLTHLAYPFSQNLRISASVGLDWNPAFADVTGSQPTNYGLRELRLDWRPSKNAHITFGYASYPHSYLHQQHRYRSRWGGGLATWGPSAP